MFKVGDRVRVIVTPKKSAPFEKGSVGTVVDRWPEDIFVTFDNSVAVWDFKPHELELFLKGTPPPIRTFETGATRDSDEDKLDYEGFLSPVVLKRYAQYLHKHRKQSDGQLRSSDNWQNGIPKDVYMKSLCRHFMAAWEGHRAGEVSQEDLCGILFNTMGYLFEELRKDQR